MICNRSINLIEQSVALAVVGALARGDFFHGLAVFCHRQLVKALVGTRTAARLLPEVAEARLELAVAADVVVRVVTVVRDRVDVFESERFRHFLRCVQDEVLRAVGVAALCDLLDDVLGILHVRPLHGANPERPLARFVGRDPEHHLIEVRIIEAQHDGQEPFLALAGMIRQLEAQMTAFIMAFPKNIVFLLIKAQEYIFPEMLCQLVHVLLDEFGTLVKRRLIVEESTRRLLVDKGILLRQSAEERITHEELMQAIHTPHVQQAAPDEDHHAPGLARILCIVDFLS